MEGRRGRGQLFSMLVVLLGIFQVINGASLSLNVNQQDGSFSVSINNVQWLSSAYTKVYSGGNWYASSDNSLQLASATAQNGSDVLGDYYVYIFEWSAKVGTTSVPFQTSIRTYPQIPNAVVFSQLFPDGLPNSAIGSEDAPISIFPSFAVAQKLGYLHFAGDMAGFNFQTGVFPNNYQGGYQGGPLALFDNSLNTVVLSPLSFFLSAITNLNSTDNVLITGVQGKVLSIPEGFSFDYILYLGEGVNDAVMGWGDILLTRYGKVRNPPTISTVVQYLGYSTTAYYFYNPIDGNVSYGNYEATMLSFNNYSRALGVPYRYYLLDSWWYGEYDVYGGVWMWEDNHELLAQRFPHGLEWLHDTLGMPFACHMGKWVADSPYTKNETYGFIVEPQWAIPTTFEFWDYIFGNASGWGLNTIKQDHINEQLLDMNATLADVTTARLWLLNEGRGAYHHGINIEYCMDYTSVLLTSLENPTATHSRAGGDYLPGGASSQWRIGVTSIFLWAIGLYPDKDTFYTTTTEVIDDHSSAPFYKFQEPYPLTHAMASSMSAGPITPSDGVGGTDKALVMRMCASDGLLLKPDQPAVNIDSTWIQRTFGSGGPIGPQGDVITSYTQVGPYTWHFVFAAELTASYDFLTTDLLLPFSGKYVAFLFNATDDSTISVVPFGEGAPLAIPAGSNYGDAYLWIASPVLDNGWVFLGETDKFITVSKQRFKSVNTGPNYVQVLVSGQPGESVRLVFVAPSSTQLQQYQCTISASGLSLFSTSSGTCIMQ